MLSLICHKLISQFSWFSERTNGTLYQATFMFLIELLLLLLYYYNCISYRCLFYYLKKSKHYFVSIRTAYRLPVTDAKKLDFCYILF